MSGKLLGEKSFQAIEGQQIRETISEKVTFLKKKTRILPIQFKKFNERLAQKLLELWIEEDKEFRKNNKKEKAIERYNRWKEMSKKYRLIGINELTNEWYDKLWKLRAEVAFIAAVYEYSEITEIPKSQLEWKAKQMENISPIVLRMKGPHKPNKKKILMKDIKFNISEAYLDMIEPLVKWAELTKEKVAKLVGPRKVVTLEKKIKRYREAFLAREYLTVLCQAVAPRQDAVQLDFEL